MNRLHCFIVFFSLLVSSSAFSQMGYLFIKNGAKKKKTFVEGDQIHLRLNDGSNRAGYITLLRNDTIFVNGMGVPTSAVKYVIIERKPKKPFTPVKTLLMIGGGAALTTAGLTMSKQAKFKEALIAALVIGYAPLLIKHFGGRLLRIIPRHKFKIGKKFRLQVLDFYINNPRLKSF